MQLTNSKCSKKRLCGEFKIKNFTFNHKEVDLFYRCQWQSGDRSWFYLIYRWMLVLFFGGVFLVCLVLQFCDGKYFIFLTNWGIMLCLMTQLLAAVLVTRWHFDFNSVRTNACESRFLVSHTTKLIKIYWLMHGVTMSVAVVITTIYWTFLHGKMNKPMRFPVLSFVTHCLNSVFMCIDFFMVAFPVRLLHTVYAMLLPIIYFIFTIIYFVCGGTDEFGNHYVYPILDWTIPVRGVVTFAGVFMLYVIFALVFFSAYKFKCILYRSLKRVWAGQCVGLI